MRQQTAGHMHGERADGVPREAPVTMMTFPAAAMGGGSMAKGGRR